MLAKGGDGHAGFCIQAIIGAGANLRQAAKAAGRTYARARISQGTSRHPVSSAASDACDQEASRVDR